MNSLTMEQLQMFDQINTLNDLNEGSSLLPALYEEFMRCNSVYDVSEKESSECISSDGEFIDANKIDVFNEDDSMINVIETKRERKQMIVYQQKMHQEQYGGKKWQIGHTPSFKQLQ